MARVELKTRKTVNKPWRLLVYGSAAECSVALEFPGSWYTSEYISLPLDTKLLSALEERLPEIEVSEEVALWRDQTAALASSLSAAVTDKVSRVELPEEISKNLYDYQTVGAKWLSTIRRGILADAPGLGKTRQAIAGADLANARRILVLTINETVQRQWAVEIGRCSTGDVALVVGTKPKREAAVQKPARWYVGTVSLLSIKDKTAPLYKWLHSNWDVVILDEAHLLQGKDSTRGENAGKLRSSYAFLLTGTPLWNRPQSIWNLLHIIDPARFTSYWNFINDWFIVQTTPFGRKIKGIIPNRMRDFKALVHPYLLRRELAEVFDEIPKATHSDQGITPSKEWETAYKELKQKVKRYEDVRVDGAVKQITSPGSVIPIMRRFCNSPAAMGYELESEKTSAVMRQVAGCAKVGFQVLVFTWHKQYCVELAKEIGCKYINGDVPQGDRAEIIDEFKRGQSDCLVATMASMGTGVDLPDVDVLIFAETDWTAALIEQAWRRIYRVSSLKDKFILYTYMKRTVDELVYKIFTRKATVSEEVLAAEVLNG